jgi:VWFA-related protein
MPMFSGLLAAAILITAGASAQTLSSAPTPEPTAQSTVLHTSTQLVVVDVVVQDKDGHPVHGLEPENFRLIENKTPQAILHFEEHFITAPVQGAPALPKMPPGTFTDYTPVPPDGTLNILLLDALNTPTKDQSFVRLLLQQYVKQANPGTRIAIFGLANRLILLQGFTSDPETLKDVVDHKLIPRSPTLLNHQNSSDVAQQASSETASNAPGMAQLAANLQQFEQQTGALQTQLRTQFTLDAFNTLAHYLAAFPGRKNLIWFSGSFPLNVLPGPSLQDPFAIAQQLDEQEYRETTNLLSRAQVAVYPIDARDLMTQPMHDLSANPKKGNAGSPGKSNADLTKFATTQAAEHATMEALASGTGGKAVYDSNDLSDAVSNAINAGANYYTLTYNPTDRKDDGTFCDIHISIVGSQTSQGLQLAYRHGYYTNDAAHPHPDRDTSTTKSKALAYLHAAMSRGAPTPQDLLFKVRVLPASNDTEPTVAPANTLSPDLPSKGPFRRYDVDYIALPNELTLTQQPDGHRNGQVEFLVYVFDLDGRLLNATGKTFAITLTPADYDRFIHSAMECHIEVSVPISKDAFLRIGIRDIPSNKFGVVEIPTSVVSHLAPAIYPAAPPAQPSAPSPTAPSKSQPPSAVPSTQSAPQAQPSAPPPN